jgi:MoxR-like ATPase
VIPDDIKVLVVPVLQHRLILNPESRLRRVTTDLVLNDLMKEVAVPAGVASWKGGAP